MSLAREEEVELLNHNLNQNQMLEESKEQPDIRLKTNINPLATNHLIKQNKNNFASGINNKNKKGISNNSQIQINNNNCNSNNNNNNRRLITKNLQDCENEENEENKKSGLTDLADKDQLFFENKFDCKVNKHSFYLRFFICVIGLFFIGLNSLTNCLVTEEESEGMKDKIIEILIFFTEFLKKNSNIYAKALPIVFAVLYDAWVVFGIFIWIIYGKSNRAVYSTILFFSVMLILQNLFLIEMPLVRGNFILIDNVHVNSFFLNLAINKNSYYNGHVGFLLIVLFEILENEFKVIFYFGLLFLTNLIAYLMALHSTNSLCVISGLLAALYFDKMAEIYICKYFDVIEIFTEAINRWIHGDDNKKNFKEPLEIDSNVNDWSKIYMNYDENFEERENLKKDQPEEYEKYLLDKKENNVCKKVGVNKVFEDRLNEKIKMNDFLLINKEQKQGFNNGYNNKKKIGKKTSFDYNITEQSYQELNFRFEEDKENKDENAKEDSEGGLCLSKFSKQHGKKENLSAEISKSNDEATYLIERENEPAAKFTYLNSMKVVTA